MPTVTTEKSLEDLSAAAMTEGTPAAAGEAVRAPDMAVEAVA